MNKSWRVLRMFLGLTLLTGALYPLAITGIAQLAFHKKANGGFISLKGQRVGAELIGQKFESNKYFWGRPSSIDYNPLPSGGSNLGPTSLALKKAVTERQEKMLKSHSTSKENIPCGLLFASGSGLDPHISPETAYFQVERIAKARGLPAEKLKQLIDKTTLPPSLGFLGSRRVNVLLLNLSLDSL